MSTNKTLILFILCCLLAAAGIYVAAYIERQNSEGAPPANMPSAKVAASSAEDGTYVAQVHSITTSPEDTTVTFTPVEYFDGEEAAFAAEADLSCDDQPIAACAPTLTRGYYVRASGEADFTAPVTADTKIMLRGSDSADVSALKNIRRQFDPVFEVRIENGVIAMITEKSPL